MIVPFLFLLTGIIGVVTLFLMIRFYKSNPFCNFFLILIIAITSFRFLLIGSYTSGLQTFFIPFIGKKSVFYLTVIPCFYLYYKHLIIPNKTYNIKDFKHFIFILLVYFINSNETINNSLVFYFGSLTNFILISIFIIFYLIIIFNLLSKKIWFKKDLLLNSKHLNLVKNWTFYLFVINMLTGVVLIASLYTEVNKGVLLSGNSRAIFFLFFWLFMFFKILTSPEILFGLPILNSTLLKFKDSLSEERKGLLIDEIKTDSYWILETESEKSSQDLRLQENIKENILSYIKEVDKLSLDKINFRSQKFSQSDIAEKLGVPTSHIVYLFKYHSKTSFSEYRMNRRIQDAITLIKEGFLQAETLESLAFKTGFASYNPFFSAFKKITGYSPQEYLKITKNK